MTIYVGNLSFRTTEDELRRTFEAFGDVSSAKIITDPETGSSRGFGFIEMPNTEEAKAAIEGTNGKDLGGRALRVSEAKERSKAPPRSGGGSRAGGSYGGRDRERGGYGNRRFD